MDAAVERPAIGHAIVQLTTFCNINCSYCYLSDRSQKSRVSIDTVRAIISRIHEYDNISDTFHWQWHAGEPLTVGLAEFRKLHEAVLREFAAHKRPVEMSLQTNGVLIDDSWADFFAYERIGVGVSIDGPADIHDLNRRTRRGDGTHAAVVRGLRKLVTRGAKPSVICVVGPSGLSRGEDIISFLGQEGVQKVGFNFEEMEGENSRACFSELADEMLPSLVHQFVKDVVGTRDRYFPDMHLREFDNFSKALRLGRFGRGLLVQPFSFLTFGHDGQVYTFSPELAGGRRVDGSLFTFGSVHHDTLESVYRRVLSSPDLAEIRQGVEMCKATCGYFDFCGGGSPGNKYFENGTFASTSTQYCTLRYKHLVDGMLQHITDADSMPELARTFV